MTITDTRSPPPTYVGILRRLGALTYDSLLLLALLLVSMAIITPFTDEETIRANQLPYFGYLLSICFLFFGWFWTHGGQTLGMRAWKIRLETFAGEDISWGQALSRFVLAIITLGTGLLWCLFNPRKLALYDHLTGTHMIRVKKGFIPPNP
jgi:uncharacterized RDD family membrane protein YckC